MTAVVGPDSRVDRLASLAALLLAVLSAIALYGARVL